MINRVAISIRQPWAWLVVNGYKDIENRSWQTNYKGLLIIHAGKKRDRDEEDIEWAFNTAMMTSGDKYSYLRSRYEKEKVLGALIGSVMVDNCVSVSDSYWFSGPFGFVMSQPKVWGQPIPYRGALGLFSVTMEEK